MVTDKFPEVSVFSRAFAAALSDVMRDWGIGQVALGQEIGRTQAYVSERLRGVRTPETDMIAGVARLSGRSPRSVLSEVMRRVPKFEAAAEEQHLLETKVYPIFDDVPQKGGRRSPRLQATAARRSSGKTRKREVIDDQDQVETGSQDPEDMEPR